MESFIDRKRVESRKLKEWIISGKDIFPKRKAEGLIWQITSLALTRKFQTFWFKIPLLGKSETAVRFNTDVTHFWEQAWPTHGVNGSLGKICFTKRQGRVVISWRLDDRAFTEVLWENTHIWLWTPGKVFSVATFFHTVNVTHDSLWCLRIFGFKNVQNAGYWTFEP